MATAIAWRTVSGVATKCGTTRRHKQEKERGRQEQTPRRLVWFIDQCAELLQKVFQTLGAADALFHALFHQFVDAFLHALFHQPLHHVAGNAVGNQ